jgi:hypothetical protein
VYHQKLHVCLVSIVLKLEKRLRGRIEWMKRYSVSTQPYLHEVLDSKSQIGDLLGAFRGCTPRVRPREWNHESALTIFSYGQDYGFAADPYSSNFFS